MARASEEPDFGEVKGLLRRLETSQEGGAGAPGQTFGPSPAEPPRRVRVQQGPSSAATLLLIANTMMTTATMTSIAWYLFHSAEMQRKNGAGAAPPPGAIAWPPRDYTALRPEAPSAQPATASVAQLIGPEVFDIAIGRSAPLPLEMQDMPATADHVSARGLPGDISFNKGKRSSPSSWIIPISDLSGLELVAAPNASAGNAELAFIVLSGDSRLLGSAAMTLTVTAATSETSHTPAVPAPDDAATLEKQVAKGREFLAIGQVGAARLVLQRAAGSGSAEAALLLGDTYDPVRLFQLGARGLVGDVGMATSWYEKADALGSSEAKARIASVGKK